MAKLICIVCPKGCHLTVDETTFEGTINIENEDSFLWTSIPYDESWEIVLDGEVLSYAVYDKESGELTEDGDIVKVGGGLIGIRLMRVNTRFHSTIRQRDFQPV